MIPLQLERRCFLLFPSFSQLVPSLRKNLEWGILFHRICLLSLVRGSPQSQGFGKYDPLSVSVQNVIPPFSV